MESIVDKMKPYQVAYNLGVNKIWLSKEMSDILTLDEIDLMWGSPSYWRKYYGFFQSHKRYLTRTLKLVEIDGR